MSDSDSGMHGNRAGRGRWSAGWCCCRGSVFFPPPPLFSFFVLKGACAGFCFVFVWCARVCGGVLVGWVCWRLGGCDRELVIMISEKVCDARAEHGESLDQMFLYSGGVRLCFA